MPAPVPDRGGFRVDTGSEKEAKRWVFPQLCDEVGELTRELFLPRHFVKLCGSDDELGGVLPDGWELRPLSYFMRAGVKPAAVKPLPDGYSLSFMRLGAVTQVQIHNAGDGALAASGYAAETAEAFVYDRIETMPAHRRKGLGSAVMRALGNVKKGATVPELLTASEDGLGLYTSLGWTVLSPYATAVIAEG